ncbi:hypothetical protein B0T10DRAFT_510127 [Thelonectria olida]|uniref:Zonadhesin n=1 Tax=Thelonectria olida TaxID=1576542 RepID=A0A9P8WBT6_9HYPO|nr:hypothetical protein B0T10DRAFT_510127 [Thelonectria olida]
MYSQQPGLDAAAYEYDAQYQPQSSDERVWDDGIAKQPVPRKAPNYKPTPLRWMFIACLILSIMALMALVVWAKLAMPDSDNSYTDLRDLHHRALEGRSEPPQDDSSTAEEEEETTDGRMDAYRGTTTYTTKQETTVTMKGTTGKFTTAVPTTLFTTQVVSASQIVHSGGVSTSWVPVTYTTQIVSQIVNTQEPETTEIVHTSYFHGWLTFPYTGSVMSSSAWSSAYEYTETVTLTQSEPETVATTYASYVVSSSASEVTASASTETVGEKTTITSAVATSTVQSVGTTTQAPTTFITLGKVTITSVYTDPDYKRPPDNKPTQKPTEKVIPVVSVQSDTVINQVKSLGPVTRVKEYGGSVETIVATQAPGQTIVSKVGGYTTAVEVVTTGADGVPTTKQVVSTSTVSGKLTTFTSTFKPTTYVTTHSKFKTTITSSRSGSTTIHSTRKGKTRTFESTATVTPTETAADAQPTDESVKKVEHVYNINDGTYFVGKFLPPFLSVMLSIPARIIDLNAQLYQPFYALSRPNGGLGPSTMTLHFGGWTGFLKPFAILSEGQPVTFFTMLIVWCSALMTPVATEAIGVKIHGYCTPVNPHGCAAALGVSPTSTRALLALLALTIVLLCLLLLFLRNWDTGLYANPWSVAGIASLATNREIRSQKNTERKMEKEMRDKRYGFGYFENQHGHTEYGIVLYDDAGQNLQAGENSLGTLSEVSSLDTQDVRRRKRRGNPFIALGMAWRLCFILFLVGLMVLILYYGTTFRSQNKFQNFMASQTFGIRFMFAAIGVIISFGWGALFISVAMIVPYQVMSYHPQSASNSILLTRPTNPFFGVWSAFKHGQPFPAVIALMAIFSEFMPILLANIPYTITQTEITHKICLWLSTAILGLMVLTIAVSFYIVWPHMPVDPRSIAGAMYYVSESGMLNQFDGMASLDGEQREKRVQQIGGRYWYGEVMTQSGETRPAVERDDGTLHLNEAVARQPALQINANPHNIDTAYHGYQPEPTTVVSPQQTQSNTLSTNYSSQHDTTSSSESGHYVNTGYYDYQPEVNAAAGLQQPETLYDPYHGHQQQQQQQQQDPTSSMSLRGNQNDDFNVDTAYHRHQH